MLEINFQFFGGRGSGGGKGGGGGSARSGSSKEKITEGFEGSYTKGSSVKFTEGGSRYTTEDRVRIPKNADKTIDRQVKSNGDGTATQTHIVKGSDGNLYAVDITYNIGEIQFGTPWYKGPRTTDIRKVKRK